MTALRRVASIVAAALAAMLTGCATGPEAPKQPVAPPEAPAAPSAPTELGMAAKPPATARATTQNLRVATDPAGATCTVRQGSTVVASLATTPASVTVLRQPETPGSFPKKLEIVCRMESYLEERVTVGPERVERLARDEFFAALQWQIEAAGAQRRARSDENCFPFPCDPPEGACAHPSCVEQRSRVDDDVSARVDQLRSRLADTRVVSP